MDGRFRKILQASLLLKGLNGVVQFIGGMLLLLIHSTLISRWVVSIAHHELFVNPENIQVFLGSYLMVNGFIKIILVVAVWKNRHWAFPLLMSLLGIFISLQAYRLWASYSFELLAFIVFNCFVLALLTMQYTLIRRFKATAL